MLEVFIRPEHQNAASMDELAMLIGAALHYHYDNFDDYKVSDLGITDSLETVLPALLNQYRLKLIHDSCESEKHPSDSGLNQNYTIHCLVFTEKHTEYIQYHLTYLARSGDSLRDTAEKVANLLMQLLGVQLEWIERSSASYRCRYETSR